MSLWKKRPDSNHDQVEFARELRTNLTDAERTLRKALRDRRLNRWKFRRQHPFGKYVVDFICVEIGLVVELDGGQHNEAAERIRDVERTQFLENEGLEVIRFWNHEFLANQDAALEAIYLAATRREELRGGEG